MDMLTALISILIIIVLTSAFDSFASEFLALENPLASLKGITRKIAFPVLSKLKFCHHIIGNI